MTNRGILLLAAKIGKRYEAGYVAYREECETYRAEGFRPRTCEHGTSQWTDYDNICAGCEDGETMADGVYRRSRALANAHERWKAAEAIFVAVDGLRKARLDSAIDMDKVWAEINRLLLTND